MNTVLSQAISAFAGRKTLLIGDVILDRYVCGNFLESPSEPNIPVVKAQQFSDFLGGAANVAANIRGLQGYTYLLGVIGLDESANKLTELLQAKEIDTKGLKIDINRPTTLKTRIVINNQIVMRVDRETVAPVSDRILEELYKYAADRVQNVDAVIISDYAKGLLSDRFLREIIQLANLFGKPIIVDPKGNDFSKYKNTTVITPNELEASRAVNKNITNLDSLVEVGHRLLDLTDSEAILITKGENGMTLFCRNGQIEHFFSSAKPVRNTIGAGDTVVSALALGLAASLDTIECVRIANHAAGLAVGKQGTTVVTLDELRNKLQKTGQ